MDRNFDSKQEATAALAAFLREYSWPVDLSGDNQDIYWFEDGGGPSTWFRRRRSFDGDAPESLIGTAVALYELSDREPFRGLVKELRWTLSIDIEPWGIPAADGHLSRITDLRISHCGDLRSLCGLEPTTRLDRVEVPEPAGPTWQAQPLWLNRLDEARPRTSFVLPAEVLSERAGVAEFRAEIGGFTSVSLDRREGQLWFERNEQVDDLAQIEATADLLDAPLRALVGGRLGRVRRAAGWQLRFEVGPRLARTCERLGRLPGVVSEAGALTFVADSFGELEGAVARAREWVLGEDA